MNKTQIDQAIKQHKIWLDTGGSSGKRLNLSGVSLKGMIIGTNLDLSKSDLSSTDLSYVNLEGVNLSEAILNNSILFKTRLSGADLSDASLVGARVHGDITGAYLEDADLTGADIRNADFSSSDLTGVTLVNARISVAAVARLQNGATYSGINIDPATNECVRLYRHILDLYSRDEDLKDISFAILRKKGEKKFRKWLISEDGIRHFLLRGIHIEKAMQNPGGLDDIVDGFKIITLSPR